jgi:DNA-dependent RNA polymerase auxiliary subunit epsilon
MRKEKTDLMYTQQQLEKKVRDLQTEADYWQDQH